MSSQRSISAAKLRRFSNRWVALSSDQQRVMGSGVHPRDALKEAYAAGEKRPVLMRVPKDPGTYILHGLL